LKKPASVASAIAWPMSASRQMTSGARPPIRSTAFLGSDFRDLADAVAGTARVSPQTGENLNPLPLRAVATMTAPSATVSMTGILLAATDSPCSDQRDGSGIRSGIIFWICSPAHFRRSRGMVVPRSSQSPAWGRPRLGVALTL
jgi:hypothetical protein